ncbi:choice-of-anchor G family protein, partial [Plantibacter sp. YIM 135347]|uniref:choice-of-anchor G family protein n=1 Tax=Plantibacter sp. YIM 135347 TaxID=3423919 RepID=UPI003D32638D
MAATAVVGALIAVGSTTTATAAPTDASEALGRFLQGQAAGINLDSVAAVQGALAQNPSGVHPTAQDPLSASVLNAISINLGDSLQLFGPNGVINLGAVAQYASAQDNGDALAASGAVNDQGAISVGGSPTAPANANINLTNLLTRVGVPTAGILDTASVELGALSGQVSQTGGATPVTDYQIAGATLKLQSPLVKNVYTQLQGSVNSVQTVLNGLQATLNTALNLPALNLGVVSAAPTVNVTVPNLSLLLPTGAVGSGTGVTVDLTTGAVTVDLALLLASDPTLPDLNDLGPNTSLLSGPIGAAIAAGITAAITAQLTSVVSNVQAAVQATQVKAVVQVKVLGANAVTLTLDAPLSAIQDGSATFVATGAVANLLNTVLSVLGLSLNQITTLLLNAVLQTVGGVFTALTTLNTTVTNITTGLAVNVVGPVLNIVRLAVDLTANAQPAVGDLGAGSTTVRAVQVSLVPALSLASIGLGSATVRGTLVIDYETAITATPGTVNPGGTTTITGTGFAPNEAVTISAPGVTSVTTQSSATGTISAPISI